MKLVTQETRALFHHIGRQEGNPDPIAVVKFFSPWSNWTWYATEFNEAEGIFF